MEADAASADPFAGLSSAAKLVVAALRGRHRGASVEVLADDTGLGAARVVECLQDIEAARLAERECRPLASFHLPQTVEMWRLSRAAWAALRWMPPRLPPAGPRPDGDTSLPVELWPVFWSGQDPSEIRLPRDAETICETLLQAPMPEARIWAMLNLPADVLLASRHGGDPLLRRLAASKAP